VLHNFNLDGFDSLYPRYRGGRPPTFTLAQYRAIKQLAISHEGLRVLLRQERVSFQRLNTWKQSPEVVIRLDEFGPLNLQPHPDRQWTSRAGGGLRPRRRRRATYADPHGVRHPLAAYDLCRDRLYGHVKARKRRGEFLVFLRAGLCAHQCLLAEPDRGAVHRAAVLRCGRQRPRQPHRAGQHDPPLHRLAEPQHP
jgi:hypothetical protein